jgi:hypothetical protein
MAPYRSLLKSWRRHLATRSARQWF